VYRIALPFLASSTAQRLWRRITRRSSSTSSKS
jgi:hypothetical protein